MRGWKTRVGDNFAEILIGPAKTILASLSDSSVQTCVTSPPYYGLRDYGVAGQIGLEKTPEEYVEKLVEVFREVRRVLRDDGTLWVNLGDSYNGSGKAGSNPEYQRHHTEFGKPSVHSCRFGMPTRIEGLKSKDLIGIPWMIAFTLRADGWYLRQDIIWHKPNPMPESVRDRCTKAHEYLFLLSKSERYYYDSKVIKESALTNDTRRPYGSPGANMLDKRGAQGKGQQREDADGATRNRRSVWTIAIRPYKGAHFATFPPALIRPCILAGAPPGGVVLDPFIGSGTTAEVALAEGRSAIGIELNPAYLPLIQARVLGRPPR